MLSKASFWRQVYLAAVKHGDPFPELKADEALKEHDKRFIDPSSSGFNNEGLQGEGKGSDWD